MNEIIKKLEEVEKELAEKKYYNHAQELNMIIESLKNKDSININNNQGQTNIATGNSNINAKQTKKFSW